MRTLKEFWSFANDETTLTDAEIVAKGEERWSPLAEQALREAACMIADRMGATYADQHEFGDPKVMALELHPQAFEALSLAIGEALKKMWAVVPGEKREEPLMNTDGLHEARQPDEKLCRCRLHARPHAHFDTGATECCTIAPSDDGMSVWRPTWSGSFVDTVVNCECVRYEFVDCSDWVDGCRPGFVFTWKRLGANPELV